jgi:hypothetical protein
LRLNYNFFMPTAPYDGPHSLTHLNLKKKKKKKKEKISFFLLLFYKYNSNKLQQKRKNTTEGPGQPKIETNNESTRGQCFRRCGPISSRHGCHKARVTIEGDFKGVLSHKDPNTKTGVNRGKIVQQISPIQ